MVNYDPFRLNEKIQVTSVDSSANDYFRTLRLRGRVVRLWSNILITFCVGFIAAHSLGFMDGQPPDVNQLIIGLIGIIAVIWVGAVGRLGSAGQL